MGRILSRGCRKGPIHFLVRQFLCSTWQVVSSSRPAHPHRRRRAGAVKDGARSATARLVLGTPPPRTVIGDPWGGPKPSGGVARTSLQWVGRRTTPSGTTPSRTKCHRAMSSLRAKATIIFLREAFFVRASNHLAKALSFW